LMEYWGFKGGHGLLVTLNQQANPWV
jgi:hypothetical protein